MARITCAYCGGAHGTAAEVRACWAGSSRPSVDEVPLAAVRPPSPPAKSSGPQAEVTLRPVLGRSVLVPPGGAAPEGWQDADRVAASESALEVLEDAWRRRRPLVIEDAGHLDVPDEVSLAPPWSLTPHFAFPLERLVHAATANAYDVRGPTPRWAPADAAVALGAGVAQGPAGDGVLLDGRAAWCDGGPLDIELAATAPGGLPVVHRVVLDHGDTTALGTNGTDADLAPDQRNAVTHPRAAARILAPAGSGKTRVLTERARHLLRRWRLPGSAVCLVAFNRRAAGEMQERTGDLPELQVRTLNSLALAIVSGTGRFGPGRTVETVDERDVRRLLDGLVQVPRRRANTDPIAAWIEALSAVRLGLRPPAEVEADFGGEVEGLPEVFDRYRAALGARGVLDYDEQIYRALEVLLTDPVRRRQARHSCRLLLVDEFQDLTPAHLLLIRLLAGPEAAVFGVGDDDQVIYGYAGASPAWLIDYQRYFPGAGDHPLEVNYRCPPAVVHAAGVLLGHNRRRVAKQIRPAPDRPPSDGALSVRAVEDPVAATVGTVGEVLASGAPPGDVAVLARVHAALAPVQVALGHEGVPVRRAVGPEYLERSGVAAALAWLRVARGGGRLATDDVTLTARRPPRALSPKVIEWMADRRSLEGMEKLAARLSSARDREKVEGYVDDVRALRGMAASSSTHALLLTVRDTLGLGGAVDALDSSRRLLARSAQGDDLDALVALAALHADPSTFEAWLRETLSQPGAPDGATLATIHAVKGREWPHVVVHGVSAGLLPHRLADDVEEERRVFHVGITRGSRSVTVVAGEPPSPFVRQLSEGWEPPPPRTAPSEPPTRGRPRPGKGRAAPPSPGRAAPPSGVVEALKEWRRERARRDGVPAYVVLSDATLDEIAARRPRELRALAAVKGIGPTRLERYGDEILAVVDAALP